MIQHTLLVFLLSLLLIADLTLGKKLALNARETRHSPGAVKPQQVHQDFSVFFMADPQPWRLRNGIDPNKDKVPWESQNLPVADSIKTLFKNPPRAGIEFGIINGDLTEFGRATTRESLNKIYGNLGFPVYYGLGNHDYANNVGDCTAYPDLSENACAASAIDDMQSRIINYCGTLPYMSFDIENVSDYESYYDFKQGSYAYSWDWENIHFVQLQNYPTYKVLLDQWANEYKYDMKSSLNWLDNDLRAANSRSVKAIILNYHDSYDHFPATANTTEKAQFGNILTTHHVTAIFAGHAHSQFEYTDHFNRNVPVYVADSLFDGGYYLVTFKSNVMLIDSYNNGTLVKQLPPLYY